MWLSERWFFPLIFGRSQCCIVERISEKKEWETFFMARVKLFHPHKMCISEWPFFACDVMWSVLSRKQSELSAATTVTAVVLSKWVAQYIEVIAYRLDSAFGMFLIDDLYLRLCPIFSNFRAHIAHMQCRLFEEKKIQIRIRKLYRPKYVNSEEIHFFTRP